MKKRIKIGAALLALLLCASLAAPALAADNDTPNITWLSTEGQPYSYNEKLGWLTLYDSDTYCYSTIDLTTGNRVEYDYVGGFFDGLAQVQKGNYPTAKYGFIDITGAVVVPLEYDYAENFSNGLARIGKDREPGYIDMTGAVVVPLGYYDSIGYFSDGLVAVGKKDAGGNYKYGYIDNTGAVVVPLEYDYADDFSDGLARVKKGGKLGYIDRTGAVVVPLEYDRANNFSEGLALVVNEEADGYEKCYIIDGTGTVVVPLEYYDWVGEFNNGLALAQKDIKYGYIDRTGAVVIPLEYDGAEYSFSGGLAWVKKNGKYGFIDRTGAVVLPVEYDSVGTVYGGENDTVRLCYVQKGLSYGIFENPYYMPPEEESGGILDGIIGAISGDEDTPAPSNGFPVIPVVITAIGVVVVMVLLLGLRRKKPVPVAPPAVQPSPEVKSEQSQASMFCPQCGTKVSMDTNFCPKCGKQLEDRKG